MQKKYQIFVSSTFRDLMEERQAVLEAILELNHIPCGMEAFPANNSTPFELIKRMIDDSDYYVLIIGGRYGSINEQGISYTEAEYDYASETKKHILCFIHGNPAEIAIKNADLKNNAVKKLEKFKQKVSKHIHKSWTNKFDLKSYVLSSLSISFTLNPMPGWVKLKDEFEKSYLVELNELQKKHTELQEKYIEIKELYTELKEKTSALSHYIKNLRDKDGTVREDACKALGYMREQAIEAVPDLVSTLLYDASPVVKIRAIEALREIDIRSKEVAESFIAALKNKNSLVRETAAKALGSVLPPSNDVIAALINALTDKAFMVRVYSMEALMLLDESLYKHVVPVLQESLESNNDEVQTIAFNYIMRLDSLPKDILWLLIKVFYSEVRRVAETTQLMIKALLYFEKKGQPVIDTIISYKPEKKISYKFLECWLEEDNSAKGMELVVSNLKSEFDNTEIQSRIIKFGSDIIPVLIKYLQLNPFDKIWLVEPLIKLDSGLKDNLFVYIQEITSKTEISTSNEINAWHEVILLLENYDFGYANHYQIWVKAIFLKPQTDHYSFYNGVIKPALKSLLDYILKDSKEVSLIIEIINNVDDAVYGAAQQQILDFGLKNQEVLEAIWNNRINRKLHNDDLDHYYFALKTASYILKIDPSFLPVIISWFNKTNSDNQLSIIERLVESNFNLQYLTPFFINMLNVKGYNGVKLQYGAVRALEKIGPAAIQSIPYLVERLRHSEIDLKLRIEDAIRIIKDE